eukprot:403360982
MVLIACQGNNRQDEHSNFAINRDNLNERHSTHDTEESQFNDIAPSRFTEKSERVQKIVKLGIGALVATILVSVTLFPSLMPQEKVQCLEDNFLKWTENANTYFKENNAAKKGILITLGLMMDSLLLIQLYIFSLYGKTWRFPIAVTSVYLLRFLTSSLFQMAYPEGYIWEFPGMYSLTVRYGKQNDFYFCVYIALAVIHFFEFKANKYYQFALLSLIVIAAQFLMLLFLRGHYFIDLFCACVFGHYFFNLAERASYLIDTKVFGIPFHKRFPYFPQKCGFCKSPINEWLALNGKINEINEIVSHKEYNEESAAQTERDSQNNEKEKIINKQIDKEFSYAEVKGQRGKISI